jgi:hypothetical protein
VCCYCGHPTAGAGQICTYHLSAPAGDDWATSNRIMCDFVHRGFVAPVDPTWPDGSLHGVFGELETESAA